MRIFIDLVIGMFKLLIVVEIGAFRSDNLLKDLIDYIRQVVIKGMTTLPDTHWSTKTDCLQCPKLGDRNNVVDMEHDFALVHISTVTTARLFNAIPVQ